MNINLNVSAAPRAVFVKPVPSVKPVRTLTVNQKKAIITFLDSVYGEGKGKYQTWLITQHFNVFHWTQLPASRFCEAMQYLHTYSEARASRKQVKPAQPINQVQPSKVWQDESHPDAPVDPETQVFFAFRQFEFYKKWFTEQAEIMDYCAASCKKTYQALKGQYIK